MKASNIILPAMVSGGALVWAAILLLIGYYWWAAATFIAALACLWAAFYASETWVKYWFAFWRVGETK